MEKRRVAIFRFTSIPTYLSFPPHLPPPHIPLEMFPDFRPEQAFLRSIKPFLNPRGPNEPSAKADANPFKAVDWHDETLEINWKGLSVLTLKYQVIQPYVVGIATYFAGLLIASFRASLNSLFVDASRSVAKALR
ncbi:hypothetical protein [Phaffia rhodozyma]|uniref:Uncharacterized protein n=1 Tax=Phaffia rhodozyma TaxID=264483 RepID=A0A0F7SEF1_PHARH|nr:hypothetical protein [Phaffia rhodozyma]